MSESQLSTNEPPSFLGSKNVFPPENTLKSVKISCEYPKCSKQFSSTGRYNQHKAAKHAQGSKCPVCRKDFADDDRLAQHLPVHYEEKAFRCTFPGCNKSYAKQSRLEVHLRTHTGEKPYTCEVCNSSFTEKGGLKTHQNGCLRRFPYMC